MKVWYRAARPFTLTASIIPVLVGTSLAAWDGFFNPGLFILVLMGSILVQVGTNLIDEYYDHARNPNVEKFPAPHKVIALGLLSPRAVALGAYVSFGAATVIGLYIVAVIGWPILVVALASALVAYCYSAGPKPLGDLGLGEVTVFIYMGLIMVMASYYVQVESITWRAFWASLPVAFLVTAILVANDIRDRDEDMATHKRTPVVLLGTGIARWMYSALVFGSFALVVIGVLLDVAPVTLFTTFLALPKAISMARILLGEVEGPRLNILMRGTAGLHMQYGLLMVAGFVAARFV